MAKVDRKLCFDGRFARMRHLAQIDFRSKAAPVCASLAVNQNRLGRLT